jgi:YfiH family protein
VKTDPRATRNRLPDPGAGFVWGEASHGAGSFPILRPRVTGCEAVYTTRLGGVSGEPFDELNVSYAVGDGFHRVLANRDMAGRAIDRGAWWSVCKQVHGSAVHEADTSRALHPADAVWTDDPERTVGVLSADCVLVLLVGASRVGVAHAGWRGMAAGVIENAIEATAAQQVFCGPAIGPCCFEVGADVHETFAERFGSDVLTDPGHVDLWLAAEIAARGAGAEEVHTARLCTSCNADLFFSHRRDRGLTGRQALIARIDG